MVTGDDYVRAIKSVQKEPGDDGRRYLLRNRQEGDLVLSVPAIDGKTEVKPKETFVGTGYHFDTLVCQTRQATLVEDLTPKETPVDKLILDQPDAVTVNGRVENVVTEGGPKVPTAPKADEETLLTEGPLDGIEIIGG